MKSATMDMRTNGRACEAYRTDIHMQLKSHRKRSGFSQEELAFLIGLKVPSAVSRYEQGERQLDLKTAFAYQIVFSALAHQLVPQLFADVCRDVTARARALAERLRSGGADAKAAYKLQKLASIINDTGEGALPV